MEQTMKPLVIYHANCADGFGAAFAAWLKFGDEAEYLPMKYGEVETPEDFDWKVCCFGRGKEIYILDFSFPKPVMDAIFATAKRVVWLDHHKTAFEMWCRRYERGMRFQNSGPYRITIDLNDNKSGAMIAWEYFHPGTEIPMLIKHIDDYDRWQFKLEGTKEFNKALWSYAPWTFEQWEDNFLPCQKGNKYDFGEAKYMHLLREGGAILRAHNQNVQAVVKGAARECSLTFKVKDMSGSWYDMEYTRKGLAANCPPHLASDVGHQLANQSGTYGLLWYINKDGKCVCSLRSNGYYDVSAIAKAFGGGGHKNAAGFEVAIETLLEWIK